MVATVRRAWRRAKNISQHWLVWARNTAAKFVLLTALLTFQLWLAFFMYGTFYYAYMPTELHTKPVYLDFSLCDRYDGSELCPFPNANISLVRDQGRDRLFMPGQKYQVGLFMEMPESPVNEDIGVFMLKIQMFSKTDEVTAKSLRPAMLRYRSPLLKMMDVVFLAPLFLTGYSEETQMLHVDLMNDYVDNAYKPAVKVRIEVRTKQLEMYRAVLKIHAQFTGIRYLMFYWPLCSAVVSVSVNFCFLSVLSMMIWRQCVSSLIDEPTLEERDMTSRSPVLSYEERRRLARQSMEQERSTLFSSRPPHVTIIDPVDPPTRRVQFPPSPTGESRASQHQGSHSRSPQRSVHRRPARTQDDGVQGTEQPQSSGISSDNSDSQQKGGKTVVETLKGEESISGSSQSSEDSPSGYEKVDQDMIGEEQEGEEEEVQGDGKDEGNEEDNSGDAFAEARGAGSGGGVGSEDVEAPGLRHRSVPSS